MVHQHYGTQTVNRGAVMPGMLVKHKDGTWTASANLRGRLYLHRGIERTYTRDLLVEVFLDGRGTPLRSEAGYFPAFLLSERCALTARQHGYQLVVVQELKISVSMTSGIPGQAG